MPSLIGDALRWHAVYTPDKTAIVTSRGRSTYSELWSRATGLAVGLAEMGVGAGDRVAFLLENGAPCLELYQAVALLGAAVVPLNFRFVASEIEYVVNHSEARVLVFDAAFGETVHAARPRFMNKDLQLLVVEDVRGAKSKTVADASYERLIVEHPAADWPHLADPEACYFQGYTSGTTGFPKGCVNPHRRFADCLRRLRTIYGITSDDVEMVAAPLFHEAPALFALTQLFAGGTVVVTADSSPASVFGLMEAQRTTWAFMVPTMWTTMVMSAEIRNRDCSSMRILLSGGSPLPTPTKLALLDALPHAGLNEFYGATEVGLVSNLGPEDQRRKVRSVGRPVMGMHVEIRDDNGQAVPAGETGEIHVGGSILIREYFRNQQATAQSFSDRGYFTLGDMGRFDDEGYLYIVDRKKDMIISGGENIFPNDIEDVLYQHPAVQMSAVIGAPDERWGEVVVAVVVLKADQQLDESELIAHCKRQLSAFKVPKRIEFRSTLPLSSFGKILRREVRRDYWRDHEVQV